MKAAFPPSVIVGPPDNRWSESLVGVQLAGNFFYKGRVPYSFQSIMPRTCPVNLHVEDQLESFATRSAIPVS